MNQNNNLIKKFGSQKRWVNWTYKTAGGKQTKVPIGKSNDSITWSTYDALPDKEHIGIMFGTKKKFLGIDIDHCVQNKKVVHEQRDEIVAFLKACNTYTELSPSKTGIHVYFEISDTLDLVTNKKAPYECYSALRFFTVTGESFGKEREVRTIDSKEALQLLALIRYPWGKDKKEESTTIVKSTTRFDDVELLKKMFNAKNGEEISQLYGGQSAKYNNDLSNADAALCSHLAFWTGKDADQMERIWLSSGLGQREKTQSRADYRKRTIANAIANCKEVYTSTPQTKVTTKVNEDENDEQEFDFVYTTKGKVTYPTLCTENIAEVLRKHPLFKGYLRFDEFKGYSEINNKDTWKQCTDNDSLVIQSKVVRLFAEFQTVSKNMIFDAIDIVAQENKMDSAKDYMTSLVWDGNKRLDNWLCSTYGVPDDSYHRAVASNWMKGLVKRIMVPGCKFDYVLVLEGEQGTKKSSSLNILGGDWHIETTMGTDTKDFFMQFHKKVIVEFSEGETLSRTEVKRMKAIITTQVDTFRPPYGRNTIDYPRRCVFAMTTNTSEYLKDETGNRRWLPVATVFEEADVEWLAQNRDQLFAEAYQRVIIDKETTWEFPKEDTRRIQDLRRISDPNEDTIIHWYTTLPENHRLAGITVLQVNALAFGNTYTKEMNRSVAMNISNVLKNTLHLKVKRKMIAGVQSNRWYPKEMTDSQIDEHSVEENLLLTPQEALGKF